MEVAFGRRSGVGCWGCVPLGVLAQRGALLRAVRQRVLQPLERLGLAVQLRVQHLHPADRTLRHELLLGAPRLALLV